MDRAKSPQQRRGIRPAALVADPIVDLPASSPVGLGLLDVALRFRHVSESFAQLSGTAARHHVGRRVDDVFPELKGKVARALDRLLAGQKRHVAADLSPRSADGAAPADGRVWRLSFHPDRDARGHITAIRVVANDVTAVRNFRRRLSVQHAFQDLLIRLSCRFANLPANQVDQQIDDGLRQVAEFLGVQRCCLSQLDRAGRLVVTHSYAVPGFVTMPRGVCFDETFPWVAGELRRGQVVRLRGPDDLPPAAAAELEWMRSHGAHAHLLTPVVTHTIPLCVLSATASTGRSWPDQFIPRLRLAGTVFAEAVVRQRADEDLERTRESLAHMVRVTTMGQLAASITHEINQPLCAMVGNAQAALRFMAAGPDADVGEAREALADIVRDGKRAGEVIARTHAMLKRHDVQFSPQDVNALFDGIRPVVENYAMLRKVRVRATLAAGLPAIRGHGVQLQQVLTNLLVNAVDAIPAGGRGAAGCVTVSTEAGGGGGDIVVRVTDNGVGLPPGDVEQVFQPFFTSKAKGLGMGLNISRTIVEAHGGRLWAVRNLDDRGATFQFTIPAAAAAGVR